MVWRLCTAMLPQLDQAINSMYSHGSVLICAVLPGGGDSDWESHCTSLFSEKIRVTKPPQCTELTPSSQKDVSSRCHQSRTVGTNQRRCICQQTELWFSSGTFLPSQTLSNWVFTITPWGNYFYNHLQRKQLSLNMALTLTRFILLGSFNRKLKSM